MSGLWRLRGSRSALLPLRSPLIGPRSSAAAHRRPRYAPIRPVRRSGEDYSGYSGAASAAVRADDPPERINLVTEVIRQRQYVAREQACHRPTRLLARQRRRIIFRLATHP